MVNDDFRKFGEAWAHQYKLIRKLDNVLVLAVTYTRWQGHNKLKILCKDLLCDEEHQFNHYEVYCYGTKKALTDSMIPIDDAYANANPSSISEMLQTRVLRRIS